MTSAPSTATDAAAEAHRWRAFAVAVTVASITILDLTKVNVALPSIETALGAQSTELQLVVSGYVLTFGLTLVPMGRLGDQRSRRTLFLVGLALFTITSLICALATSSTMLLVGRLLQGVAAGVQMPQVLGLVQQLFTGAERGRAFGLFGAVIGLSTAFGPTLGGLLIAVGGEEDGWRLIFWLNIPLALAAMLLAIRLLPRGSPERDRAPLQLDPVGVLLFGITVLALLVPFLLTTGSPEDDPRRWWSLVVAVAFGTAFAVWERHYAASGRSPLIPFRLLRIRGFRNGTLLATAYFAALPAIFLLSTLFMQEGLGLAPVFAGMVSIGFALASAATSWYSGKLVNRYGRALVVVGLVVVAVSVLALALVARWVSAEATPFVMAGVMLVAGLGGGVVISPNQTITLADVPVHEGGLAGSMGQLGQRIGTAIGTAIALSLFYAAVFAEEGSQPDVVVYQHAYDRGLLAVGAFVLLALAAGLGDLRGRRATPAVAEDAR
ncbi:MFS transporter [Pseudactinotalea suaedae]|uniref:MFS transporter n=1 Tax=Pseudactinotalea suaedae TaxID=1524924 RepID=UPI0012E241B6|nr:MFS transporter [Pseudactinotalea suaedae]